MNGAREPSLGELADDLHGIRQDLGKLVERIDLTYVRRDVFDLEFHHLATRVVELEGKLSWAVRTAIAGALLPILVVVITTLIIANGGPR